MKVPENSLKELPSCLKLELKITLSVTSFKKVKIFNKVARQRFLLSFQIFKGVFIQNFKKTLSDYFCK